MSDTTLGIRLAVLRELPATAREAEIERLAASLARYFPGQAIEVLVRPAGNPWREFTLRS